ncbi:MAG: outer membrane protein assembly factor BamD [Planctomycetota bacterium]|jgi:outer membrane protein assembly factor BamD (BamD/ComL family)
MTTRICLLVGLAALWLWAPLAVAEEKYEWRGGEWVPVAFPAPGTPEGELSLIRELLDLGEHKNAIKASEEFLEKYPLDERCAEAMILAAQAEMDRGRYLKAFERFEQQLKRYPRGRFFERALSREFEIGEAFLAGRKRVVGGILRLPAEGEGASILTGIAGHAPRTLIAQRALLRVADHYMAEEEYAEALMAYDAFLEQFGKSKLASQAMLRAARAAYGAFEGTRYDETPLLEAEQRFRSLAAQFPAMAAEARVEEMLDHIASLRAQKLHETGKFYERLDRPKSAAFYYRRVTEEFPQTMWAAEARAGLIRLGESEPKPGSGQDETESRHESAGDETHESEAPAAADENESGTEK